MSKKESQSKPSPLTYKQVGRTVILVYKTEKMTLTFGQGEKEKIDQLKKNIEIYNKLPSQTKLDRILSQFKKKTEAKKVEKKKVKKDLKEIQTKLKESTKKMKQLKAAMGEEGNRFVVKDGNMYLYPYMEVPLPASLVKEVEKFVEQKISLEPLVNFWLLALLNPNPVARTKMFDYLTRQRLILTPNGYFVTYRMVKKTNDPNKFTHAYEATSRLYYTPGTVCRIPRSECDEDGSNDCSKGLHTGTPAFIGLHGLEPLGEGYVERKEEYKRQQASYGTGYGPASTEKEITFSESFGNQAIICLVNPAHVVSVPDSDTRKMRSCEFFFWKTTTVEEVKNMQFSEYLVAAHEYHEFERKELEMMLKATKLKAFVDKTKKVKGSPEYLQEKAAELRAKLTMGIDNINNSLSIDSINNIIQSRIKKLKK